MEHYGKIWGSTSPLFHKNNVSIHRIQINKGYRCSKHYHQHKHNTFYVESGKLKINVYQKDYDLVDTTILHSGQSTNVPPGLYHEFESLEDTIAYEIYYVELDNNDIIRANTGSAI